MARKRLRQANVREEKMLGLLEGYHEVCKCAGAGVRVNMLCTFFFFLTQGLHETSVFAQTTYGACAEPARNLRYFASKSRAFSYFLRNAHARNLPDPAMAREFFDGSLAPNARFCTNNLRNLRGTCAEPALFCVEVARVLLFFRKRTCAEPSGTFDGTCLFLGKPCAKRPFVARTRTSNYIIN